MNRFLSIILIVTLALCMAACAKEPAPSTAASENTEVTTDAPVEETVDNSDDKFVSAYPAFKVTSESLDGKYWVDGCVFQGGNASPQLSWEPVEGATTYVIYMVDLTAYNIIHWKSEGVNETNLPQGWASSAFSQGDTYNADYVGPNPPSGSTNQYNIYVFALKAPVERVKGSLILGLNLSGNDEINAAVFDMSSVGDNILNGGKYGIEASIITTAVLVAAAIA